MRTRTARSTASPTGMHSHSMPKRARSSGRRRSSQASSGSPRVRTSGSRSSPPCATVSCSSRRPRRQAAATYSRWTPPTARSCGEFDTTDEPEGDETPSGGAWNTPARRRRGQRLLRRRDGYYSHNSPERLQNQRLYTDSAVRLNAESGELDWYYQAVTNDFWDWDLHLSPILVEQDGTNLAIDLRRDGHRLRARPRQR